MAGSNSSSVLQKKIRVQGLHLRARCEAHLHTRQEDIGKISEGTYKKPTEYIDMTVYVRTINGKTISTKRDRHQKVAKILETVERKTSIPQGMLYLVHLGKVLNDKKTREENNIEAEATIEMSLRLLGGK